MGQIYPYVIEYFDDYSTGFNCITAVSFDGGFDEVSTGDAMDAVYSEKSNGERIDYGARYQEVLELNVTLLKSDYTDFTRNEKREILKWLSGRKQASWLKLYDQNMEPICEVFGRFIEVQQKTADSRTVGFLATFEATSPYPMSPLRHVEQIFTGPEVLILENDGDVVDEYVMPYMEITPLNEDISELVIYNKHIDETVKIKNIRQNETLVIDNANKLIFSNDTYRIIGEDFYGITSGIQTNYPVWCKLSPGDNRLELNPGSDTCRIKYVFKYRYPIKLGGTF